MRGGVTLSHGSDAGSQGCCARRWHREAQWLTLLPQREPEVAASTSSTSQ